MTTSRLAPATVAILASLQAVPAAAEVMDKVGDPGVPWFSFVFVSAASALLARIRPWCAVLVLPLSTLAALLLAFGELEDPSVGPAIWREDPWFAIQSYVVAALCVATPFAVWGLVAYRRQHRPPPHVACHALDRTRPRG